MRVLTLCALVAASPIVAVGAVFQAPVVAAPNTGSTTGFVTADWNRATASNGRAYVAYTGVVGGQEHIFFTCETTPGRSDFIAPVQVSSGDGPNRSPQLAVDSSGIAHIVWVGPETSNPAGTDIYFARVNSSGGVLTRLNATNTANLAESSPTIDTALINGSSQHGLIFYVGPDPSSTPRDADILVRTWNGSSITGPVNISDQSSAPDETNGEANPAVDIQPLVGSLTNCGAVVWEKEGRLYTSYINSQSSGGLNFSSVRELTANLGSVRGTQVALAVQPISTSTITEFVGHLAFLRTDSAAVDNVNYLQFSPIQAAAGSITVELAPSFAADPSQSDTGRPAVVVDPTGSISQAGTRRVHIAWKENDEVRMVRNLGGLSPNFDLISSIPPISAFDDSGTGEPNSSQMAFVGRRGMTLAPDAGNATPRLRFFVQDRDLSSAGVRDTAVINEFGLLVPTPTPSPSPTPTPSATPSPSPTQSPTPTPTPSPSPSPQPTASPTPTPSPTPGPTPTAGPTATPTPGPTATPFPTATPSPSPSPTASATPTPFQPRAFRVMDHVTGVGPFLSGSQFDASDVDNNGLLDAADIVALTILGLP